MLYYKSTNIAFTKEAFPLKYWRGYLVAAIFAACTWGLAEFAKAHWALVDMVYPYVTRLIQDYLVNWSAGTDFCLWQLLLIAGGVLVLASVVLMVIFKWNPIQWFGWVVAAVAIVGFLNTAVFGLNDYSGSIAQDIRLDVTDYSMEELEDAAEFYLGQANILAEEVSRNGDGTLNYPEFQALAAMAADGFHNQTYERFNPVFAGNATPVKVLSWENLFSKRGITGLTVGITGEAAVNPQTPTVAMPFVMCRQMAERMCITGDQDAAFAAFMACDASTYPEFRYAGYFMAYRYCYETLLSLDTASARAGAAELAEAENAKLKQDLASYNESFAAQGDAALLAQIPEDTEMEWNGVADMLVSWHIQEYVLPAMEEEEVLFDPLDPTQIDLTTTVETVVREEEPEETTGEEADA